MSLNNEPTDRQIDYARSLGIYIPYGITFDELSDLISNEKNNDKLASDRHKGFADYYNIKYSKNIGKNKLFERIQEVLFSNNLEKEMASWFVFRVYRSLVRGQEDVSISMPDHEIIQKVSLSLLEDPKFKNSLKRYRDQDLRFFGEFTDSYGVTHYGASKTTNAYQLASTELKKYLEVQKDMEKAWNSSSKYQASKVDQEPPTRSRDTTFSIKLDINDQPEKQQPITTLKSAEIKNNDIKEKLPRVKSLGIAYFLLLLCGFLGLHRFYLGRKVTGIAYILICFLSLAFSPLIVIIFIWLVLDALLLPKMIKKPNFF